MKPTIIILVLTCMSHAAPFLKIEAGPHARSKTPVTVAMPSDVPKNPALKTTDGAIIPLQLADDKTAAFILPELAAGKSVRYELISSPEPAEHKVLINKKDGALNFEAAGKPVGTFIGKATQPLPEGIMPIFQRGGYLHPLFSPAGNAVTGDYPMNHFHHHGIWTAWTKAVFQGRNTDFWNMGDGLGKVDSEGIDSSWSGPVHGGMEARNEFTDLTSGQPVRVLSELWTVKVFATGGAAKPYNLLELVSEQQPAGDDDLELPEYHYGAIGIRGPDGWNGAENATFLTSEGVTNRDEANGKPAKWIAMSGGTGEELATLAILGSPENFRAPQPLRVHPKEPFVSFSPQTAGDMAIRHGGKYLSKYRFVITDGEPDKDLLDRLWNDYAEPPSATWE